ncbi:MAG: hypothetical protein KBD21_01995 [Candidatus Pacebacteria bacterium]|nr:hypothetical protein [Candidatus Paceibacterota bacterium]
MKKIKDVPYADVVTFFEKEHPVDESSPHFAGNKWAMKHLEWANEVAEGQWSLCELDSEDVLSIVLAHHSAEETGEELVGQDGMLVYEVVNKLESAKESYSKNNPTCWKKIMYWHGKDFSPLLLSTKPTKEGKGRRSLVNSKLGSLFHQDGLHRVLCWGMDGRFNTDVYSGGKKLTAFIAGRVE